MTNNNNPNSDINIGDLGEKIAGEYLEDKGYRILEKNYRVRASFWKGEIDIISEKDDTIIFIEVKSTINPLLKERFPAEERVNDKKRNQLIRLANYWLVKNKTAINIKWQIDIIRVVINFETKKARILHFKNAVSERR